MRVAQKLYEGVTLGEEGSVGLISYMRTDSVSLSDEAVAEIRDVIARDYGTGAVPDAPNKYQSKSKNAQDAPEAIRPPSALRTPATVSRFHADEGTRCNQLRQTPTSTSQSVPPSLKQPRVTKP